jgi:hypothetical protein
MVSDVCQVQHLKLELADGYITIINTFLTPYAPHLSSLDITFFYQPEIPVTKNVVLAPLTSSLGGTNRKFNLHAEKHS